MAKRQAARSSSPPKRGGFAKAAQGFPAGATVDPDEIVGFERQALDWWDPDGPFRPLHRINPIRMQYIADQARAHWLSASLSRSALRERNDHFSGFSALDIGCGGGLVSEGLAKMGFQVTAIDAGQTAIDVAHAHAKISGVEIDYRCTTAEELVRSKPAGFDLVTVLEIVEHVENPALFVASVGRLLKPGGLAVFSTLNRTIKSFMLGIVAAEYVLGWVARGTHSWQKFLQPAELETLLAAENLCTRDTRGLVFHPITGKFGLSRHDLAVNYFLCAVKT